MRKNIRLNCVLFILFALLCFPMFYFVYKYWTPNLGMIDFVDYYKLYSNMDFKGADSPLNMRLVSSFFIYCLSKTGFVYDTLCQIDTTSYNKSVYFNAVFFNYLSVVFTCIMIFHLIKSYGHSILMSFLGGVLYILGFGTIFFELLPLTDAFSVLLFAIILFYNHKKSFLVIIPLIILILQREYVIMAFGLMACIDYIKYREKYYLYILISCVLCFISYVILRKSIFETTRYSYHTSPEFMINSLSHVSFPLLPFLRQTFMTLNLGLIYILIIAYKFFKKIAFDRFVFLKISLLFIQLLVLTFLLGLGNNAGRYFYILVPVIIIQIINELKIFESALIKQTVN